jgi:hypothetical protein
VLNVLVRPKKIGVEEVVMVEVSIEGDTAVFAVQGSHKLWALRSRLEIPLAHITEVHTDPSPKMGWFQGLKVLGTDIPNLFRAGTFYQDGGWVFWDVRHPDKTVVVELQDEQFQRLVIEVSDPAATVALLKQSAATR